MRLKNSKSNRLELSGAIVLLAILPIGVKPLFPNYKSKKTTHLKSRRSPPSRYWACLPANAKGTVSLDIE
jgi:hypothetical protein